MVAWKMRGCVIYKVKAKFTLELKGFSSKGVWWVLGGVEMWGKKKE
jgi:hypothetical protein